MLLLPQGKSDNREKEVVMTCYAKFVDSKKSKQYKYVLMGSPVPLARPRFARGHVWDSQGVIKQNFMDEIRYQHGKLPMLSGPIHADVTFFMAISSTASCKRRERMRGTPHIYRPDFSNMLKFIEDVCHGIVYKDDCIISSICGSKIYEEDPRTEIIFSEIIYDE